VSKLCVSCVMTSCMCDDGRRREEEEEKAAGYRTKNKNPTQRCGEKMTSGQVAVLWSPVDLRVKLAEKT